MAYVAVPAVNLPVSQNCYNPSSTLSKYGYRTRRPPNYSKATLNRNYETSFGAWSNDVLVNSRYGNHPIDSQNKFGSNWRNSLRTSRRFSHSVDTAPFFVYQNNYSALLKYSPKYAGGGIYNKRTGSQPEMESASHLYHSMDSSYEHLRAPCYGVSKNLPVSGSAFNLHKYSPQRESFSYANRPYHWRNSKPFRNTSGDSSVTQDRLKDSSSSTLHNSLFDNFRHVPRTHVKTSFDDRLNDDSFRKGDVIGNRYQIVQEIGRGSFGKVYKAMDNQTGKLCALKCIKDISNFRKLADEEIAILSALSQQDANDEYNFLHLNNHFLTSDCTFMVFDLLSVNLFQLIHRNSYRGFSPRLVRKFVRCILNCLKFLHRNKVIHCDLKPENILLERCGYTNVKVIDFGSSCYIGQNAYAYIQSRFYRAPEVIFGSEYEAPIDIWSLGCIAAELLTGSPLFPGENEQDQIACIMEVLGLPPASVMRKIRRLHHFFTADGVPRYLAERAEQLEHQDYHHPKRMNRADPGALTLEILVKNSLGEEDTEPKLLDFLSRCLRWDPAERMTAYEALQHPWILEAEDLALDGGVASPKERAVPSSEE
ncbi:dual specificity [Echinococcus multilocularis]|uniref:Dual specificity n=1 Tax=Echinococcus multilocularis TaxID=6211 RepID=A0A068YA62_ECHMU|nr:dual specificity [Echinococcus multilocularis]